MPQELAGARTRFLAAQAIQRTAQFQMLPDRQRVEERRILRQDADDPSKLDVVERDRLPGDAHLASRRCKQTGQQLDGC